MKYVSQLISDLIALHGSSLQTLDENLSSIHPAPGKWSQKEELGHLIDSAHNNLRRFIVAQLEHESHIIYAQDDWVRINNYGAQPMLQLARLWLLLNHQIIHILENMPEELMARLCDTGRKEKNLKTIEWLARDYADHLKHHLHHILGLEPFAYPAAKNNEVLS